MEFGGGKMLWGIINIKDDQNIAQEKLFWPWGLK